LLAADATLSAVVLRGAGDVTVTFTVTNTGKRAGAEVAQLYLGQQNPTISRPIRELKGFQKIFLQPGQSQKVTLKLNQRSFAYFNETTHQWDALAGNYGVFVGSSSQDSDLKLTGAVDLPSEITVNP
jgi:beta-glucosidase